MIMSESINELAAALAKAQTVMAAAAKDSDNPFFHSRYADLASCWAAWRPAGPPNGLALLQFVTAAEERLDPPITVQADGDRRAKTIHFIQRVSVETRLVHSSGQFVSETLTVLVKDDSPQSTLSGETYCRRGGMMAITGIAPEDDDGNEASNHGAEMGQRDTVVKPKCPECGKSEFVLADREINGRFFCWKNNEKKKFGCGHKWDAALHEGSDEPKVEPPKTNGKAKEVAKQHGMKTADQLELPHDKTPYHKALAEIQKAVQNRDKEYLGKVSKAVSARTKEGVFTAAEDTTLMQAVMMAEDTIEAAAREPVGEAA